MQLGTARPCAKCSACTATAMRATLATLRAGRWLPRMVLQAALRNSARGETRVHWGRRRTGLVHRMGGMSKYLGASAVPRLKETEGSVCTFAQPPSTIHMPFTVFVRPGIRCAHRGPRQPAAAKVLRAGSACLAAGDLEVT